MAHKIRHLCEYAALRIGFFVFWLMPVAAASATGGAIFRFIGPKMGITKTARRNIQNTFPDWDDARIEKTLTSMWDNLGRIIAEYPHLQNIAENRTSVSASEIITKLAQEKKAALFATGHFGNWEIVPAAALYHADLHADVAYRAPNNPYVDALIVRLRSAGGKVKSFGKTRRGLADILKALSHGGIVGMLIDQKMNTGMEASFFERPAMTSTAFVELPLKVGCPLIPLHCVRKPGCYFDVIIEDPIPLHDDQGNARPTADVVNDMHKTLEGWITQHPEQWLWLHRRWKD